VVSRVFRVQTPVSCNVDTDHVTSLAVVHVTSARCLVAGFAFMFSVNCRVISRVPELPVIVRVTRFCRANIAALGCVESRVYRFVSSATIR